MSGTKRQRHIRSVIPVSCDRINHPTLYATKHLHLLILNDEFRAVIHSTDVTVATTYCCALLCQLILVPLPGEKTFTLKHAFKSKHTFKAGCHGNCSIT